MTRPPADLEFEQLKARDLRKLVDHKPMSRWASNLAPPVNAVVAARIQRAKRRGSAASESEPRQRSAHYDQSRSR